MIVSQVWLANVRDTCVEVLHDMMYPRKGSRTAPGLPDEFEKHPKITKYVTSVGSTNTPSGTRMRLVEV